MNRRNCAGNTQSTRKRKSTAFRNWATICCVICESSYPKSGPRQFPELDDTPRELPYCLRQLSFAVSFQAACL
jgi:hypothetical protein